MRGSLVVLLFSCCCVKKYELWCSLFIIPVECLPPHLPFSIFLQLLNMFPLLNILSVMTGFEILCSRDKICARACMYAVCVLPPPLVLLCFLLQTLSLSLPFFPPLTIPLYIIFQSHSVFFSPPVSGHLLSLPTILLPFPPHVLSIPLYWFLIISRFLLTRMLAQTCTPISFSHRLVFIEQCQNYSLKYISRTKLWQCAWLCCYRHACVCVCIIIWLSSSSPVHLRARSSIHPLPICLPAHAHTHVCT